MRSYANWTRLALIALTTCAMAAGTTAHAQTPAAGAVPPGWVWQGVWHDGQWNGQWIPGPGAAPGAAMPGAYPPPQGGAPWGEDPRRMMERCHGHRHDGVARAETERGGRHTHDRDCDAFDENSQFAPPFAQGYPAGPPAYGPMAYPPVGYMMVPVVTGPQQPCVETRTTTTTYVVEKRRHVVWVKPHRKEKRVYTGS